MAMTEVRDRAKEIVSSLFHARTADRLHHAYIFFGPVGVGKKEAVEEFAAEVFATGQEGGLFGTPDPLQQVARIARRNHPDFVHLAPKDGWIKVDEVREVIRSVAFAPLEAPLRIVLLEDAHRINSQATNALLKTLEEPPAHTVFFLTTPDPELLLQTVRSRCQMVRFFPLPHKELQLRLDSYEKKDVASVSMFAEGSLERAKDLLSSPESLALRAEACDVLLELWESCPRIPSRALSFVEKLKEESDLFLVLDTWISLIRDFSLTCSKDAVSVALYNPDYAERIILLSRQVNLWTASHMSGAELLGELAEKCSAIHRFRVKRGFNLSLRLGLDCLISDLQIFSVGKIRQKL